MLLTPSAFLCILDINMEKDLAVYAILKGIQTTSQITQITEHNILKTLKDNLNSNFFHTVNEIIKTCVETMGIELASEYFNLNEELISSLISDSTSTEYIKEIASKIDKKNIDKSFQIGEPLITPNSTPKNSELGPNDRSTDKPQPPLLSINPPPMHYGGYNPFVAPQVKKTANLTSLAEHKPNIGNIMNPDYSYIPTDIL